MLTNDRDFKTSGLLEVVGISTRLSQTSQFSLMTASENHPANSSDILGRLADVVESRKGSDPEKSYVARLLSKGPDSFLKKIGEEATETVMAAKDADPVKIINETADLWFHCLVMLSHYGLRPEAVLEELARREGLSGLDEKAARKAINRENK